MSTPPVVASCEADEDDTCPVCYECFSPAAPTDVGCESVPPAASNVTVLDLFAAPTVALAASNDPPAARRRAPSCKVCKHAVCGECDKMLTDAGHVRCPMCRAPRRIPLHMMIHAFSCVDPACERPQCSEAKFWLVKVEVHVQNCLLTQSFAVREACEVCKLWRALNNSLTPRAPPVVEPVRMNGLPPMPQLPSQVRERPSAAQLKRMLLEHVRQCRNQRCETCIRVRRHILKRRLAAAS